jgi:hypothetical protein
MLAAAEMIGALTWSNSSIHFPGARRAGSEIAGRGEHIEVFDGRHRIIFETNQIFHELTESLALPTMVTIVLSL